MHLRNILKTMQNLAQRYEKNLIYANFIAELFAYIKKNLYLCHRNVVDFV